MLSNELLLNSGLDLPTLDQMAKREILRRKASQKLIAFTEYTFPRYRTAVHHRAIARTLEFCLGPESKIDRLMILTCPRHGKQLNVCTPTLTTKGWKSHGEIIPGDYVFHPSGRAVEVLAVSQPALQDMEVEFSNGEVLGCHENHEWAVINTVINRARNSKLVDIFETRQMEGHVWQVSGTHKSTRFKLLPVAPLQMGELVFPVEPYVLGAWLGDGTCGKPCISNSREDADILQAEFSKHDWTLSAEWTHPDTGVITSSFAHNGLGAALRLLGVYDEKAIPEIYLLGSDSQRMDLLAGLMDTDGNVEANTGRCRIVTTSEALRDGIFDLCTSLGFRPYVTMQPPALSSSGIQGRKNVWTVGFQPDRQLHTKIPRRRVTKFAVRRRISITDIRRVDPHMGNCIQVDAADGMYLVGRSMLPTHNSELASRRFPAFALGKYPQLHFISASATMPLAQDFGGEVRNIVDSPEYREIFPDIHLSEDTAAKNLWKTDQGGTYFATGVGGKPIGRGADIFLIDDPFGSMEDAESAVYRRRVQQWYQGTVYNRLQPGGKIILINHRMHEDDLSAFLLKEEKNGGDEWFVLCMPGILNAEAAQYLGKKAGDALWPEAYPLEALDRIKRNSGKRAWAGLYMQEPKDAEDGIYERPWFQLWPAGKPFPYFEFIIQSYDTAFTDETKNDPAAFVAIGIWIDNRKDTPVYNAMVIDAWEEHLNYPQLRKRMISQYATQYGAAWMLEDPFEKDGPIVAPALEIHDLRNPMFGPQAGVSGGRRADMVLVEDKGSGIAVKQELNLAGVPVKGYAPGRRSKTSRAHAMAIYAENKKVWIPESETREGNVALWADDLISQLCSFKFEGSTAHDDYVDCFTQGLHQLVMDGWLMVDEGKKKSFTDDHDPANKRRPDAA